MSHDGDEVALADLDQSANPGPSCAACRAHVSNQSFDHFGTSSLQLLALVARCTPTVLVDGFAPAIRLVIPSALPLVVARRDVAADVALFEPNHRLGLVVALVGDDFDDAAFLLRRIVQVALRVDDRVLRCLAIRGVRRLHVRSDHDLRVEVDCVLGLVAKARGTVLHLGDARIGITRRLPVVIARLLALARAIELAELIVGRGLDASFLGQLRQVGLPRGTAVAAHDRLHRRVCFECRRVDTDGSALQLLLLERELQDEREDLLDQFLRQPLSNQRQRRMLG